MSNNSSTAAMTADQRSKCHAIIHTASASAAAVGAGLAQLPGSDNAAITPIQLAMTVSLGAVVRHPADPERRRCRAGVRGCRYRGPRRLPGAGGLDPLRG